MNEEIFPTEGLLVRVVDGVKRLLEDLPFEKRVQIYHDVRGTKYVHDRDLCTMRGLRWKQ